MPTQNIVTSQSKACSMGDSMPTLLPVTCVSKARAGGQPKGHSGEGIASYVKPFIVKMKTWHGPWDLLVRCDM